MCLFSPLLLSSSQTVKLEIFCEAVPKAAEVRRFVNPIIQSLMSFMQNFIALCASNYYDGCIFHRNIRGFMVQTGDPTGTGKGGQSIWGKNFADEIRSTLKVSLLPCCVLPKPNAKSISSMPAVWLRWLIMALARTQMDRSSSSLTRNNRISTESTPSLAK